MPSALCLWGVSGTAASLPPFHLFALSYCTPRVVLLSAMASASLQHGAARAPPPPDQLASFYKLVDKQVVAGQLGRHARSADLSSQAAQTAEALFGDDSLVVADLRYGEYGSLTNLFMIASGAEKKALERRSWALLLSLIDLLQRRLAADTLLPGTIREEELDYEVHSQASAYKAQNIPLPHPDELRALASTLGYNTLLSAMFGSLNELPAPYWPTVQKRMVESFVLQGLDVIPRTAGIPADQMIYEDDLVAIITDRLTPRSHGSAFCAAVLRKWRSNAVRSVLRARGVLPTTSRLKPTSTPGSASTSQHTDCATAPSPPAPRRRRLSRSSASAPGVARRCTAAWSTRRWTGRRTKRNAKRSRRRGWLRRRRKPRRRAVGQQQRKDLCYGT